MLCSALSPADFTKTGLSVTKLRDANVDGNDGAYCVYDSKSGKVEFDIFYPAGTTPDEIKATEQTVLGEVGGKFGPVHIAGVDDARINPVGTGQDATATITVRKGRAVFDISIPRNANAPQQLLALTQIVLSRVKP